MPDSGVKIITFTGPSGAGKTTIIGELLKTIPGSALLISLTTRKMRDSDLPGEYRCGVSSQEFDELEMRGEFLWTVSVHGNTYGTLKKSVDDALAAPHLTLMHLVPETLVILRSFVPEGRLLSFFLLPPAEQELRKRLSARGESEDRVNRRVTDCEHWIAQAAVSGIPYLYVANDTTVADAVERTLFLISVHQSR